MMDELRKFFQSRGGFVVAGLVGFIGVAAVIYAVKANFGTTEAEDFTNNRWFIDADTGKPFRHELKPGMTVPIAAPSGKNTGYPAERCYWTKDGHVKQEPTLVLLNSYKGSKDPTFCPDCGRLVVGHNPAPVGQMKPPPTQAEYKSR